MKNPTPKLVCNITGVSRVTTREYLDARLASLNVTQDHFLNNYVCKDAMKLLRQGKSIDEIRTTLKSDKKHPISADDIKEMLKVNGKKPGSGSGPAISPREAAFLAQQQKPAATVTTPAAKTEPAKPAPAKATAAAAK